MRQAVFTWLILIDIVALTMASSAQAQPPKLGEPTSSSPATPAKQRDLSKFSVQQRYFYVSGQRGMDWLQKANKPDGHFVNGLVPALRVPIEGESYVRQAGAAFALARAAHFFADDRAAAIAKQALLTLLLETTVDPKEPGTRHLPIHQANPLVSAGTLLAAIHELPEPATDLLEQGDQLAQLLRNHLQADGSLTPAQSGGGSEAAKTEIEHYSGPALYGIIRSQHLRPTPWKLEILQHARARYFAYWKEHKNAPMTVWHSAAYTEAFLLTKEPAFAEAVFAMNDWLCGLQFQQSNPGRGAWLGGFPPWGETSGAGSAPDVQSSAGAVLSLVEACRAARAVGDVQRYQRYQQAAVNGLQFVLTLQYSEATTQHFADWYRSALIGGFHASGQDGNLRLDTSQQALTALVQYLSYVAELP